MRRLESGPTGIMTHDEVRRSLGGPPTRQASPQFWTTDRVWQTATDVFKCGVATGEVATAGLGPEAAPVVLDGILTLGACVPSLIGDFTLDASQNATVHDAASLATPTGLASGLLGALLGGGSLDSMAAAANAGSLLSGTASQALAPGTGLLGGAEYIAYLNEVARDLDEALTSPNTEPSPSNGEAPAQPDNTSPAASQDPSKDGPLGLGKGDSTDSDFHFQGNDPHEQDPHYDGGGEVVV